MKNTPTPPRMSDVPPRVMITSGILLLVACATTLDLIGGVIFFWISLVITLGLQDVIAKILKRWPVRPALKIVFFMITPIFLSAVIGFNCNPKTREMSALRTALGTELPTDMTDLHVFEGGFSDYGVFAFFRGSSNSIQKVVSNSIYKRNDYKREYDLSRRNSWKDLHHMGLVTNLTAYTRTNIDKEIGFGEVWVDPECRFVFVRYAIR